MLLSKIKELGVFVVSDDFYRYMSIVSKHHGGIGEKHHVIPVSVCPELAKEEWNIVNLSYQNHYRAHELLPYIVEGKARGAMLYAWNLMSGRTSGKIVDANRYAELRILHAKEVSEFMKTNQPMHRPEIVAKFVGKKRPEHSRLMTGDNNPSKREDVRRKLSENNAMKLEENKVKFRGANNASFGKELSDEHKESLRSCRKGTKMSQETRDKIGAASIGRSATKISIGDVVYESVNNAAEALNVNRHTISKWLRNGKAQRLENQCIEVTVDGITYKSLGDAVRSLGVSYGVLRSMLKHGKASYAPPTQEPTNV